MGGFVGQAICPKCGSEQEVTFWRDEWLGPGARLSLYYSECNTCGHKWVDSKQLLLNLDEILRVLGLHRFDRRRNWFSINQSKTQKEE